MKNLYLAVFATLILTSCAFAQTDQRVAVVMEVEGKVEVKTAGNKWQPATVGTILKQNDTIRTSKNSSAVLNLDGKAQTAIVEVNQRTELSLAEMAAVKDKNIQKTLLDLSLGNILIKAKKLHSEKSSFEVKTPTSVVAVRGTTFAVSVEAAE